jgi:hypothetical protein
VSFGFRSAILSIAMARIFELQRKSTLALRRRKQALLQQLRPPSDLLRASCVEQFLTCGKADCAGLAACFLPHSAPWMNLASCKDAASA